MRALGFISNPWQPRHGFPACKHRHDWWWQSRPLGFVGRQFSLSSTSRLALKGATISVISPRQLHPMSLIDETMEGMKETDCRRKVTLKQEPNLTTTTRRNLMWDICAKEGDTHCFVSKKDGNRNAFCCSFSRSLPLALLLRDPRIFMSWEYIDPTHKGQYEVRREGSWGDTFKVNFLWNKRFLVRTVTSLCWKRIPVFLLTTCSGFKGMYLRSVTFPWSTVFLTPSKETINLLLL